ncbi:hypothetical protein [Lentibacter sp.]|uniref:hypothetical protein n=1 Tax=Lentibacter sp. TaxID=2024994 RepID=UPI003F69B68D
MFKKFAVLMTVSALAAAPALAGSSSHKSEDGTKLRINCKSSGCEVKAKKPGQRWGTVEKGEGGSANYKKLVAKYKKQGFD